jgi:hypothetical protein
VAIACLVLQIKKARTLTGLNFCSRFSARFIFRRADMSDRAPANYVGRASAFRLDLPLCPCSLVRLFPEECARNPDRLSNKSILGFRLRFSGDGCYPKIEYD